MKHYIGEGYTQNGQNGGNAILTEDEVRGIVSPYAAGVKIGAMTVMPSYNAINGVRCTGNKFILRTLLKEELGFPGFVCSDWGATGGVEGGTYRQKVANAVDAGLDMMMATGGGRNSWLENIDAIVGAVEDGLLPESRVDEAVLRILRVKERLGILKDNYTLTAGKMGTHRDISRRHVAESIVLLKNKGRIMSRLASFTNILVAGEGADDIGMQCGGWTSSWQGGHGPIVPGTSIINGFRNVSGNTRNFVYSRDGNQGGTYDAAIVVVGEDPYAEDAGDRKGDIGLRDGDRNALQNAYKLGVPVIVIVLSGRPLNLGDEVDKWDALIAAYLPGSEAGLGIADVLFGEKDFVAKTPYTWRKTSYGELMYPYSAGLKKNEQ